LVKLVFQAHVHLVSFHLLSKSLSEPPPALEANSDSSIDP
jgi:hypothetical protein